MTPTRTRPGNRPMTRRGGIAVMVVSIFSTLMVCLALALDVGKSVARKQALSNACDAAIFAGAPQLPDSTRARNAANEVLAATFSSPIYSVTTDSTQVVATAEEGVRTSFAGLAGVSTITVRARSRAVRLGTPVNQMNGGIAPWAVQSGVYAVGTNINLKLGGGEGDNGNFYALALGGTGADVYRENIKYGYAGSLGTGDNLAVDTEPGAKTGPTREAVEYRMGLAAASAAYSGDTASNYSPANPKILVVPMVSTWVDLNGRTNVTIVGFAAIYLVGMNGSTVVGQFVQLTTRNGLTVGTRSEGNNYQVAGLQIVE